MSELIATPGAWRTDNVRGFPLDIHDDSGNIVARVIPCENARANAYLISAAKELYEDLESMKVSYEQLAYDYSFAVGAGDIHPKHAEYIQRSSASLAKARGES